MNQLDLDLDRIAQQDEETASSALNVVTPMSVDGSEIQSNFGLSSPLPVSESTVQAMKDHMASEDQSFDRMTVEQLVRYYQGDSIKGYSKHRQRDRLTEFLKKTTKM
jgi:hypothetical protein